MENQVLQVWSGGLDFSAADGVKVLDVHTRTSKPIKPGCRVNGSEPGIKLSLLFLGHGRA